VKYVLVPGSGGRAWYWHRVIPELRRVGHEAIAVDLPAADESAGLADYRDAIADATGERDEIILVAQSMAGFSAPLVCDRRNVRLLVLVNAMVPKPGETISEWWANTGFDEARGALAARMRWPNTELDFERDFFHDVPTDVKAEAFAAGEPAQAEKPFLEPWPLREWPKVLTRFVQGRDDRFFPIDFQRRVVRERLGIALEEMPGGHLLALSRPYELAAQLDSYAHLSES
jgi:pimeloyl-ACP methyl ester carboxylesterase